MHFAVGIILILLSAYFFLAAFLPRLRLRYGLSTVTTIFPRGVPKAYYRKPRMGWLSCFGTGLFLMGIAVFCLIDVSMPEVPNVVFPIVIVGGLLGLFGQFRDRAYRNLRYRPRKADKPKNRS